MFGVTLYYAKTIARGTKEISGRPILTIKRVWKLTDGDKIGLLRSENSNKSLNILSVELAWSECI